MQTSRMARVALALLITAWMLGASADPCAADDANEKEAAVFGITTWDGDCDADQRDCWDDFITAWYDEISNGDALPDGHASDAWDFVGGNIDGFVVDSQFVDSESHAWGDDINNADAVDALMVGMHGGSDDGDHRWYGCVKFNEAGSGNCYTYQGHIELGDHDLEFLHLSSCHSMDREDWWNEWNSSFDGLHQIDGFHGNMWVDSDFTRAYRRFADDSFWISIAEAWLDNLYYTHWLLGNRDQCPVARVVGVDQADAIFRLDVERYNGVFIDPPGPDEFRRHRARYVGGCNPRGMGALPE